MNKLRLALAALALTVLAVPAHAGMLATNIAAAATVTTDAIRVFGLSWRSTTTASSIVLLNGGDATIGSTKAVIYSPAAAGFHSLFFGGVPMEFRSGLHISIDSNVTGLTVYFK